jgi:hypothetical protein
MPASADMRGGTSVMLSPMYTARKHTKRQLSAAAAAGHRQDRESGTSWTQRMFIYIRSAEHRAPGMRRILTADACLSPLPCSRQIQQQVIQQPALVSGTLAAPAVQQYSVTTFRSNTAVQASRTTDSYTLHTPQPAARPHQPLQPSRAGQSTQSAPKHNTHIERSLDAGAERCRHLTA